MSAAGRGADYLALADYYTPPDLPPPVLGAFADLLEDQDQVDLRALRYFEGHVGGAAWLRGLYSRRFTRDGSNLEAMDLDPEAEGLLLPGCHETQVARSAPDLVQTGFMITDPFHVPDVQVGNPPLRGPEALPQVQPEPVDARNGPARPRGVQGVQGQGDEGRSPPRGRAYPASLAGLPPSRPLPPSPGVPRLQVEGRSLAVPPSHVRADSESPVLASVRPVPGDRDRPPGSRGVHRVQWHGQGQRTLWIGLLGVCCLLVRPVPSPATGPMDRVPHHLESPMNGKDFLGSRRRRKGGDSKRRGQPKPKITGAAQTSTRADPLVRAFEQGPFPAVPVQPFPPATVALFERMTGRAFDPDLLATWERVRAFTGYEGVELTGPLQASQWLEDPDEIRAALEPIAPNAARRRSIRGPSGEAAPSSRRSALPPMDLDAHDLGD